MKTISIGTYVAAAAAGLLLLAKGAIADRRSDATSARFETPPRIISSCTDFDDNAVGLSGTIAFSQQIVCRSPQVRAGHTN